MNLRVVTLEARLKHLMNNHHFAYFVSSAAAATAALYQALTPA